ncbi:MAG TPA: tRNA dihydrouridine synthase DusB [Firmicutes bacterium]|nr:tRNA dihydrouridine synthase DusB [Bacillota bacterium]
MHIGQVKLKNPLISAPMAGVSNLPYRLLAKEAGAALVCTEMVSAKGLLMMPQKTQKLLALSPLEKPVSVQLFGSEPRLMAAAAKIVESMGADIIDINMGCPVPKVVKAGEGCALMLDLSLSGAIIKAVVDAVRIPVTVKIRKGWDDTKINALEAALTAQEKGAAAVTVHGRTRTQLYGGKADWEIIRKVASALDIPVIGNGDVFLPEDAARMLAETGCAAVMIGRGGLGNPWLFKQAACYLQRGVILPQPSAAEKIKLALRHLDMLVELKGERVAVREMRKHACWYIKGLENAAEARREICRASSRAELKAVLKKFLLSLPLYY